MDRYRVKPGETIDLNDYDPADKALIDTGDGKADKAAGKERYLELNARLEELQELLYAEGKHKLLIVLQAMDAGGKDSAIRSVFEGCNPQGVTVTSFKVPTEEERGHDYLWRVHQHTPKSGMISVFNRSHYEDVLVVRVKGFVPEAQWQKRFGHIRNFEQLLADEGTTVLKFFLNVSRDEQKQRFQDRLDRPDKHWKFRMGDLDDRVLWGEFQGAYQDMLNRTSTEDAPWYIVPADRKWYRDVVISQILVNTLEGLQMAYPAPEEDVDFATVTIPD